MLFCRIIFVTDSTLIALFRVGDEPCKLIVYTVPSTRDVTLTLCLPHDLKPEVVVEPDGRQIALLDELHQQIIQLFGAVADVSDQKYVPFVSAGVIVLGVLVLLAMQCRRRIAKARFESSMLSTSRERRSDSVRAVRISNGESDFALIRILPGQVDSSTHALNDRRKNTSSIVELDGVVDEGASVTRTHDTIQPAVYGRSRGTPSLNRKAVGKNS